MIRDTSSEQTYTALLEVQFGLLTNIRPPSHSIPDKNNLNG